MKVISSSMKNDLKKKFKYIILFFGLINKTIIDSRKIQNGDFNSKVKYYEHFQNSIPIYNHTHIYSDNIYWCWLQGLDNAPKLYKATLNSVKKNCANHKILIINETNIDYYVKLPSYITEKFNKGIFSKTHFSDLLRLELLIKYGGTWIDSSVLITKYDEKFFKKDLFFFNFSSWFITAEKDSPVLKTTRDLLYEYWRKEDYLCDYFLFHDFLKIAFDRYSKNHLEMPNISNLPEHQLHNLILKQFNNNSYSNIIKNVYIHKLNNKITERRSPKKGSFFFFIIKSYI